PSDGDPAAPYPFYDRWGDSFNLSTEFVTVNQARSLAYLAWLMARTPLKNQPWKSAVARIVGLPAECPVQSEVTASLEAPGLDLRQARIIWEARDQEPAFGEKFRFHPLNSGSQWVEVEAQLPDGRRAFAATNFTSLPTRPAKPLSK
ncbi:MAG TPA: glycoside hydrolase family 9, partial [Verrucomicrobiae bacterium]|nr:glycoside hydrolase family 9 [Verrucomicrobiae bacterium]